MERRIDIGARKHRYAGTESPMHAAVAHAVGRERTLAGASLDGHMAPRGFPTNREGAPARGTTMSPEPDQVTEANLAKLNTETGTHAQGPVSPVTDESKDRPQSVRSTLSFSQRTMDSMNSMIIRSILAVNGEPKRLPTEKRKAPLSIPTTAVNFRGFVQKSGPVFAFQDGVESTLMWDDWLWSTMWMGIWAVICTYGINSWKR